MTHFFQQRYFNFNTCLFRAIGQWPFTSRRRRLTALVIFVLLVCSKLSAQIIAVVKFGSDIRILLDSIPPFIIDIALTAKLGNVVINSDKMREILNQIEFDWKSLADQPEKRVLQGYAETGRQLSVIYAVYVYIVTLMFMTEPAIPKFLESLHLTHHNQTVEIKFPFPADFHGIDVEKYYYYIIIHSYICVALVITAIIAADTMFIMQMQHACGMFAVLGSQLQKLAVGMPDNHVVYSKPRDDPTFRYLNECIHKHNSLLGLSTLLELTYMWPFFLLIGCNMMMMSVTGFQVVARMDDNPKEAIRYGGFVFGQVVHLFFLSYFPQKLMDHSVEIREHLYQSKWYKTSLYTQKLLRFTIMRAEIPCQMTAGKIMVMSLENFTAVMKTSMSYLTLLRTMQ